MHKIVFSCAAGGQSGFSLTTGIPEAEIMIELPQKMVLAAVRTHPYHGHRGSYGFSRTPPIEALAGSDVHPGDLPGIGLFGALPRQT